MKRRARAGRSYRRSAKRQRTSYGGVRRRYLRKRTYRRRNIARHHFKRMADSGTITGLATYTPFLAGYQFTFDSIPGYTEFTNLYDQYRINFIVQKWHLRIDPGAQVAASATYPKLYWVVDNDDSTAAANINELRQHSRCRMAVMNPNKPVVVKFRPNILMQAYESATTTAYVPKWKQFVDCADSSTPHYGLKIAIDDLSNTNYKVTVETYFYFTMKDVR